MDYNYIRTEKRISVVHGDIILMIVACFFVFLFPTSMGGVIVSNMYIVRNGLGGFIALILAINNRVLKKNVLWTLALILWLTMLTITTSIFYQPNDFRVAYASISGFLPTVLIWCVTLRKRDVGYKNANRFLLIISFCIILWGWGLVINNTLIYNFTKALYSQLKDNMFDNMVTIRGKPVMSFGTHSMAAFFVLMVYFFHCVVVREGKERPVNYICMALLFLLEVPLNSTTSMAALALMLFLLVWAKNNWYTRVITGILVIVGVIYFYQSGFISDFASGILFGTNANHHGFDARYLSGIYSGNIKMATEYIGVGFLRSASDLFRMNDSGFVYLFTQGNIPAVLVAYRLMYDFFKRNLSRYAKICFAMFFIWEFVSASTFISVKMVFAHILTFYIINGIVNGTPDSGDLENDRTVSD